MSRYKTFVNGGSLLPSDLNALEDDLEQAFATYKNLTVASMVLTAPSAGTYVLVDGYSGAGQAASTRLGGVWLDPAYYWSIGSTESVNPRSVYYNLSLAGQSNATAVGTVTFTAGLYAVSSSGTLAGSPVTGSTATITNPAASSIESATWSGDFAAPTAGLYAVAVAVSANAAASSALGLTVNLAVRQK